MEEFVGQHHVQVVNGRLSRGKEAAVALCEFRRHQRIQRLRRREVFHVVVQKFRLLHLHILPDPLGDFELLFAGLLRLLIALFVFLERRVMSSLTATLNLALHHLHRASSTGDFHFES